MIKKTWILALVIALPTALMAAGAIAVDDDEGDTEPGYGFATGYDSREEAAAAALKECKKNGNDNCKVVARFDKCGAYAASAKYYGVGWGATKAKAEAMALDKCEGKCKIKISGCD